MTTTSTPAPYSVKFGNALEAYLFARDDLTRLPAGEEPPQKEDALSDALQAAENRLLAVPARAIAELRVKFDLLWGDINAIPNPNHVLAFAADLRNLDEGHGSPIFDPANWLKYFESRGGMHCTRGDEVFLLQPPGADLADLMWELEAAGGEAWVKDLIRERTPAQEEAA